MGIMKRIFFLSMLFCLGETFCISASQNCLVYSKFVHKDDNKFWGVPSICYVTVLPELIYRKDTQRILEKYFSSREIDSILVLSKDLKEVSIKKELKQCYSKWEFVSKEKAAKRYKNYLLPPEYENWTMWRKTKNWIEVTYCWGYRQYLHPTYFFTQPIYYKKYILMEGRRGNHECDVLYCLFLLDTESGEVTTVYCLHHGV
jgi:hypothetical protein